MKHLRPLEGEAKAKAKAKAKTKARGTGNRITERSGKSRHRHKGGGFDIQKWIFKLGIEFHWPGYQYMGPGTHLESMISITVKPNRMQIKTLADRVMVSK